MNLKEIVLCENKKSQSQKDADYVTSFMQHSWYGIILEMENGLVVDKS